MFAGAPGATNGNDQGAAYVFTTGTAAFDRTGTLLNGGRAVSASGPLGSCARGDRILLSIRISQGRTVANGKWSKPHACTGHNKSWAITAHTTGAGRLRPGQATGRGTLLIKRGARTIAIFRWQRTITLRRSR